LGWRATTASLAGEHKRQTGLASKNSKLGWQAKKQTGLGSTDSKLAGKHKPQTGLASKNCKLGLRAQTTKWVDEQKTANWHRELTGLARQTENWAGE
jgi:hypothetical protein